jgi:hypothetical protein
LERSPGAIGIGFLKVLEPKVEKNRVHLDIAVRDLVGAKARIEELGGRRVHGYESGGFLVMADPEANEFCLVPVERLSSTRAAAPIISMDSTRSDSFTYSTPRASQLLEPIEQGAGAPYLLSGDSPTLCLPGRVDVHGRVFRSR